MRGIETTAGVQSPVRLCRCLDDLARCFGGSFGVDKLRLTCALTPDLRDLLLRLRLQDLNGRSRLLGFLLILLGLGLLHCYLGLDQRFFTSASELHIDNLNVNGVGVPWL